MHVDSVAVIFFSALIAAVILHEISHGAVAFVLGDDTAKRKSPCRKTYGEYLKKNENSDSNTMRFVDLCCYRYPHSTSYFARESHVYF